jgi:hypothetical protein
MTLKSYGRFADFLTASARASSASLIVMSSEAT